METNILNAIARIDVIENRQSVIRGTGCLISEGLVLTASHVIFDKSKQPPALYSGVIQLTFPNHATKATLYQDHWDARDDWAILRCEQAPPLTPIPLADLQKSGDCWETYGFPDANPRGMAFVGTVTNHNGELDGQRAFQLFSQEAAAAQGAPVKGLSGGPVIIGGATVGVLRWALMKDSSAVAGTLYACPAAVVQQGCSFIPTLTIIGPSTSEDLRLFLMRWRDQMERSLQDAFIDYSSYIADKTRDFVGRRFVFQALDQFLNEEPAGYFVIRGDPGIGKSALMAQFVKERQYAHHFNIAAEGISTSKQFFLNASAQIITRYKLGQVSFPPDAGTSNNFLKKVLLEATKRSPKVFLIVDALDEVSDSAPGMNPLQLPFSLPSSVYIIVSTRTRAKVLELQAEKFRVLELDCDSKDNLDDIEKYIDLYSQKPGMVARLQDWGITRQEFVGELQKKSEGNFMYLRHVLPAIEAGTFTKGGVNELPRGLKGYYQRHWEQMRGENAKAFEVNQRIIACLATARRPVMLPFVAKVAKVPPAEVQWAVDKWHEFLHESATGFSIYHSAYRDFLACQVLA